MFSTPLCSRRQNSLLPRPMMGRIRSIDHSGSAVSARLDPAPPFFPDIGSGLLTWLRRVNRTRGETHVHLITGTDSVCLWQVHLARVPGRDARATVQTASVNNPRMLKPNY